MKIDASGNVGFFPSVDASVSLSVGVPYDFLHGPPLGGYPTLRIDLIKNSDLQPGPAPSPPPNPHPGGPTPPPLFTGIPPLASILFSSESDWRDPNSRAASLMFATRGASDKGIIERVRISGTGNVGIGTPSPLVRTQIDGQSDQGATLALSRSDNRKFMRLGVGTQGVALDFDPSSFLVIHKNTLGIDGVLAGQELLRVTSDGNVGIGTPSPVTPLHVTGNLTLDTGGDARIFTGTANSEQNNCSSPEKTDT